MPQSQANTGLLSPKQLTIWSHSYYLFDSSLFFTLYTVKDFCLLPHFCSSPKGYCPLHEVLGNIFVPSKLSFQVIFYNGLHDDCCIYVLNFLHLTNEFEHLPFPEYWSGIKSSEWAKMSSYFSQSLHRSWKHIIRK